MPTSVISLLRVLLVDGEPIMRKHVVNLRRQMGSQTLFHMF